MEDFFTCCRRQTTDLQLTDIVRVWMYYIRPSDCIETQIISIAANNHKMAVQDRKDKIRQYES